MSVSLRKRPRQPDEDDDDDKNRPGPSRPKQFNHPPNAAKPWSIRDRLLQREVLDLNPGVLPCSVQVRFPDPHKLHNFKVIVSPTEGIWAEGDIEFDVEIPETYNMKPPKVKCVTPVWHPNINFQKGDVCLSLLRVSAIDDMGWTPTRQLKDVVLGLDGIFGDLVNFEDPLNKDAADQYRLCPLAFEAKARELILRNKLKRY